MVKFLSIICNFYRRFLGISLFLNILLYFLSFAFAVAISFKLMLTLLLYWSYVIIGRGKELVFYHNLGWGAKKLFLLSFLIDFCLLLLTYKSFEALL